MREQEIWERFQNEIEERQKRANQLIKNIYQKNGEQYEKKFCKVLQQAFAKFIENQQSDIEKKMKYIQVNCLRVSLETETYEYLVRVMDEYAYQDTKMVEGYYVPPYLMELISADKEYFEKLIMSKFIRAKKYEVKDFLRKYLWDTYIRPIPIEITNTLSKINILAIYDEISKADEIEVSYGELLERYDVYWLFTP